MTYYLCDWSDGSDNSHTVIKNGQGAVWTWLRDCLGEIGTGCPEDIVKQLDTLDWVAGGDGPPLKVGFVGADHGYVISEIEDLGDLAPRGLPLPVPHGAPLMEEVHATWIDPAGHRAIIKECQSAMDSLDRNRLHTVESRKARKSITEALTLLRALSRPRWTCWS